MTSDCGYSKCESFDLLVIAQTLLLGRKSQAEFRLQTLPSCHAPSRKVDLVREIHECESKLADVTSKMRAWTIQPRSF